MPTYIFTPLGGDTFSINANPVNPTNWAPFPAGSPALKALGGQCLATTIAEDCDELFIGVTLPANQYAQFTVAATAGVIGLFVRASNISDDGYFMELGPTGPDCLVSFGDNESDFPQFIGPVNVGDIIIFAALNSTLLCFQNGNLVQQITDTHLTTGTTGAFVGDNTTLLDSAFTNFVTGSIALAPPTPSSPTVSPITRAGVPSGGQIVPLTSAPNQNFAVTLQVDGAPLTLNLNISWSEMAGYWIMSISNSAGVLLLDSIPMITGWYPAGNLLAQYNYLLIGSAFILNEGSSNSDYPGRNDLGTAFVLLWDDTAVIEEPTSSQIEGGIPPVAISTVVYDEIPAGLINGINTIYTLVNAPSPAGSLQLFKNGQYLTQGPTLGPGVDYTLVGNVITYQVPLVAANPPDQADFHIASRYVYVATS